MKVHFTENSEADLTEIYIYQCDYSLDYADRFYDEITDFAIKNLSEQPRLGHEYNSERGIFRLIFKERYNIYYVIRDDGIYIIYILDGPVSFNAKLSEPDAPIPEL